MRRISPELLQKVKAATDIIAIIGEHVVLRKAGREYVGLCPFHSERSGSFYVNTDKQVYHCHGCHASGDVVKFSQDIHGLSFTDAVQELAERARIVIPRAGADGRGLTPEEQKLRDDKAEKLALAIKLNRFVAEYYFQNLKKWPLPQEYLSKRGVSSDWVRQFYAGYASPDWDHLARHLMEKKAPMELAEELGLIRPSTKRVARAGEPAHFDLFRNRVMFPILDTRGRVVGFGGRTLPGGNTDGDSGPKYLNSSDSLLFKKSRLAYGLYQAQKHIRERDEVVFVEGYFDVVALHMAGFGHAVATCGTALGSEHIDLLKRFGKKFTLLFDADAAGEAATLRAMELGLEQGIVFLSATLKQGKDPDEVLFDPTTGLPREGGKESMHEALEKAEPVLDAMIARVLSPERVKNNEDRAAALRQIGGWLQKFSDPVGKALRVESLRERYGVSADILKQLGLHVSTPRETAQRESQWLQDTGRGNDSPRGGSYQRFQPGFKGGFKPWSRKGDELRGAPGPVSALSQKKGGAGFTDREKILLQGIALGGKFHERLVQARAEMPPQSTLADLFDYAPAKAWVARISQEAGVLERLRSAPATLIDPRMDPQVLSTLTEAWVQAKGEGNETAGPVFDEFEVCVKRALVRIWARFSQELKVALADAEAKKDAELQAKLMKDYLDLQRKLKEFSTFYDEA